MRGEARTQTQVAVSRDNQSWYLLNASPDLRAQILATPELRPGKGVRQTPIAGIVLTSADVDHVLGLLHLREFQPLHVYATSSVRDILNEDNSIFSALQQIPDQIVWTQIRPGERFELKPAAGPGSGICCQSMATSGSYPSYVGIKRAAKCAANEAVLGLIIEDHSGGQRILYLPGLAEIDDSWLPQFDECDLILIDGTFWADDELVKIRGGSRTSRQMGHVPLSGRGGSLERLASLKRPRKIFIHMNNTNPILDEDSPEYREVVAAGWELARDGWKIQL